MDKPIQFENNEPDKGNGEDLATRRIDPNAVEPTNPISASAKPATSSSNSTPPNDNSTSIVAIVSVAVVALVCICACTAIIITALMMIPTY